MTPIDTTVALAIAQGLLTAIAVLIGWLVKGLFTRIDELGRADGRLAEQVNQLRVDLPERYVSKNDFKQLGDNIFSTLRRIEDKLDGKADKAR